MTIIEVLEWLLKAYKAGFDYFLADYCNETIKIYPNSLGSNGIFKIYDFDDSHLTIKGSLCKLHNPRLPQVELDYMAAMDKCDEGKRVKSLETGTIVYLHGGCYAEEKRDGRAAVVLQRERLGKWVVVGESK